MTGLKKTLLFMLVICTLGYGSAWAYDIHAAEIDNEVFVAVADLSNQQSSHQMGDHNSSEQASGQQATTKLPCNDHCGHSSAHLQAIFSQAGFLCSVSQSSELLEFSETFISYIVSPDLRPPRV